MKIEAKPYEAGDRIAVRLGYGGTEDLWSAFWAHVDGRIHIDGVRQIGAHLTLNQARELRRELYRGILEANDRQTQARMRGWEEPEDITEARARVRAWEIGQNGGGG